MSPAAARTASATAAVVCGTTTGARMVSPSVASRAVTASVPFSIRLSFSPGVRVRIRLALPLPERREPHGPGRRPRRPRRRRRRGAA